MLGPAENSFREELVSKRADETIDREGVLPAWQLRHFSLLQAICHQVLSKNAGARRGKWEAKSAYGALRVEPVPVNWVPSDPELSQGVKQEQSIRSLFLRMTRRRQYLGSFRLRRVLARQ